MPQQAVQKAVEALKEEHGAPTDREVAAAATAALVATSATLQHSKTAVGYLAKEAPWRTWLPLLLCVAAAAAGVASARRQLVWAAAGGLASFCLTVWQVLAPLVRRFQELRSHLLDNDRAAKKRLDAAAEQLHKALCDRGEALQDAERARQKVQELQDQMAEAQAGPSSFAAAAASGRETSDGSGSDVQEGVRKQGSEASDGDGSGLEERLRELQHALTEREKHDARLVGIMNNALNAAAVPAGAEDSACVESVELESGDGYNESPLDRSNPLELAAALQSRVDALRRHAQEASGQAEEVKGLQEQLKERANRLAALQAQLHAVKAEARRLPQVLQYARDLEWQLLQAQQQTRAGLEAAGRQAGAAAASTAGQEQRIQSSASHGEGAAEGMASQERFRHATTSRGGLSGAGPTETAPSQVVPKRGRGRPRGSGKRQLANGVHAALSVAGELASLRDKVATAEHHLEAYDELVHTLQDKLEELHSHEQEGPAGEGAGEESAAH